MHTKEKGIYGFTVGMNDLDLTGRSHIVSLNNHILTAAGIDADLNGFGVADLNCDNCSWVLSRVAVEYYRMPLKDEYIKVRTWVSDVGRMMTTRNMVVTDASGETIAAAVTQWAVIDLRNRTAVDIRSLIDYGDAVSPEPSPIPAPSRIPAVKEEPCESRPARYSDIDFNGHVGAMRYIVWMTDLLPLSVMETSGIKRVDVNYIHESRYGDMLRLARQDTTFEISTTDAVICRCRFTV